MAIIKDILGFYKESRIIYKETYTKLPSIYNQLLQEQYYLNTKESNYFLRVNQSYILNLLGESYLNYSPNFNSKELDSASIYFKRAYEVAQKFDPPHKNTTTLYNLKKAEVLIARKEYQKSLNLIEEYVKNAEKFNVSQKVNSLKAICFSNLQQSDSSFYYSKQYLKNYTGNNKKKLIAIYDILSNHYYLEKKLDSAFKYSELTIGELKLFEKNKNEVNKSHYLHDYNEIQKLNNQIIKNGKKNTDVFIILIIFIFVLAILIIFFVFKKNKNTKRELNNIESTIKNKTNNTSKTVYNIDKELEENILKGLLELKGSKDFLESTFNIQVFAKKLKTNTSYISYILNKEYNKSFKEFLTDLRLEHLIKKLKTNTEYKKYTIKFLAEEVGYTNASAFTRAFKKHKGITPSQFIKNLK